MPVLPDFKLETFFSEWEFNAKYHMCASDMESMTLDDLMSLGTDQDREDEGEDDADDDGDYREN